MASKNKQWRMVELYAGIGGMNSAAKVINLNVDIIDAFEINPGALEAYNHNFSFPAKELNISKNKKVTKKVKPRNLLGLTVEEWERLSPDIVTMSPPCQPFTRQGLQQGSNDPRCSSLHHLLNLFEISSSLPSMLLLENVKGFETSSTRNDVTSLLRTKGYVLHEYLLCPTQLGVPNSRLRYYLLACKFEGDENSRQQVSDIQTQFPLCLCLPWKQHQHLDNPNECSKCSKAILHKSTKTLEDFFSKIYDLEKLQKVDEHNTFKDVTPHLSTYLSKSCNCGDIETTNSMEEYLLKDKILMKYGEILDIVDKTSTKTCCFTKAYGRLVEGTGSVLNPSDKNEVTSVFEHIKTLKDNNKKSGEHELQLLKSLHLRYFSPSEVLQLMCFPEDYEFPSHFTVRQQYQLIGNSINVLVVAVLMDVLVNNSLKHNK